MSTPRKRAPRVRLYEVVARAVEEGAEYGVQRAYKYTADPTREQIAEDVSTAVISALCEVIDFGD